MISGIITITLFISCIVLSAQARDLQLDSRGRFNVSWSLSGTKPDDLIIFTVEASTTGWVGLGISKDGNMDGGDFWVAWVDSKGFGYVRDMHRLPNSGNGLPVLDSSTDVSLTNASESNGITKITFRRKLNTCDSNGDRVIDADTVRLIYAFGSRDPVNNTLAGGDYHNTDRGAKSVFLLQQDSHVTAIPPDASTFDILIDNYTIPNDTDTTYYCEFFTLPQLNGTHQIIAVDPVITPGNEEIVHHILFYACPNVTEADLRNSTTAQQGGLCFSREMSEWFSLCQNVVFGWAVGGTKLIFPENVGYSVGDGSAPVVYMMEMHYNNHMLKPGLQDFSGMRFTYTSKLRTYSMDMLQVGSVPGIFVPPKADRFRVTGFCHGMCTQEWIPPSGLTVFGYFLHAHLLGVAIQVDWYRNGKEVGILAVDDRYDFNFQENKLLKDPIQLLPGDTLKVTCTMSALGRSVTTVGGLGTSNEMCLAFLMYYPKRTVAPCQTVPSYFFDPTSSLYSNLAVRPQMFGSIVNMEGTLNAAKWSPALISKAQEAVDNSVQYIDCKQTGVISFKSHGKEFSSTDFPVLLKRTVDDTCPGNAPNGGKTYGFNMKTLVMVYMFASMLLF